MEDKDLAADRDLLDCLLLNFLKGGYFERVMEIISYMSKYNNFFDKWKYKKEYMKFHKNLYRNLRASEAKTEAQSKRLEHVRAFRKWLKRQLWVFDRRGIA
ncbi:Pentatricopeptide repeat-containing protein [Ananas comosus]|uniref:Pentatricopeptide repeat-containing protein n=1 Tax=Ananas comosus TaxID=4615 RepID=A0A199VIQ9_ANACO|nr:Pentatricopeptide repeat-containing protein [Ananas comosus]